MGEDQQRLDLEAARRGLLRRRAELRGTLAAMRQGQLGEPLGPSLGELSVYDNHPADIGTETWKRSQQLALADQLSRSLAEVDGALERIYADEYGHCERCGRPIAVARLQARPEARNCVACQGAIDGERARAAEARGGRPVEEQVLRPPFGRTWNDGTDRAGFDGEDAWQGVAQYGTSNTPSDVPEAEAYPHVMVDAHERRGAVQDVEEIAAPDGDPGAE